MTEYITREHIKKAQREVKIPFGPIGDIVDARTYRRYLPKERRRETAYEMFARLVNANVSVVEDKLGREACQKEAELMYEKHLKLQSSASSRAKWIAGTDSCKKQPASIMNCSALAVNRLSAFADLFELLMLG